MDNDVQLREFYDFDEDELYANRNGYLSSKQEARLEDAERFAGKALRIVGYVLLVLAFVPYVYYAIWPGLSKLAGALYWPFISILLIAAAIFFFRRSKPLPNRSTLKTVQGPLYLVERKEEEMHYAVYYYDINIGGAKFDGSSDLLKMITQGDTYAVYYLDPDNVILSLERIPKKE